MFGCIVAGRLVQTNLQQVDVNKYVFELPDAHNINHLVVFLLGTQPFEPGYAATVHLLWPNKNWQPLGVLSNEKPSAIFRLKTNSSSGQDTMDQQFPVVSAELGISIEPLAIVEQQAAQMRGSQTGQNNGSLGALVATRGADGSLASGKQFAERMLQNLFDYAMSFATRPDATMGMFGSGAAVQVLPVKAFEEWYTTFLRKIQRDPSIST
ncbi:hypothetical protein GGI07_003819 [Coemansia sp. Benny D115]|nr:hypothetical protein GGI07_003819 [Coemansia sp. Benny D115]